LSRFYVSLRIIKTDLHNVFGVLNRCDCEPRYLLRFEAVEPDWHLFRKYNKKGD